MNRKGKWKTSDYGSARLSVGSGTSWGCLKKPSDMCQLDRTYIGGIERGERNVALVNIEKIAKTLRISVSELFKGV